jgi:two-component sensor histidine kinase
VRNWSGARIDAAICYALTIKDNGKGLASGAEPKGLGSNIMESLAAQLGGEITFVTEDGMTTRVVFPAAA